MRADGAIIINIRTAQRELVLWLGRRPSPFKAAAFWLGNLNEKAASKLVLPWHEPLPLSA
jgi:hypothetical protein